MARTGATAKRIPAAIAAPIDELKIEWWPIERIKPYPANARKNDATIDKVAQSIKEFGWRQPIVVDAEGVIVAGHTRREAALLLKKTRAPVTVARNLSAEQIRAYRLMDNRSHDESSWDEGALALEFEDLVALGVDPKSTGFSDDEIARLVGDIQPAELPDAPDSVQDNVARLASVKAQRAKGNAGVIEKSDTEHYLVVVFPDRASRENAVRRLGLPSDERYVDAGSVELRQRIGGQRELRVRAERSTAAAPANKAGATG